MQESPLSGRQATLVLRLVVLAAVAGIWEGAVRLELLDPKLLPPLTQTLGTFWSLLSDRATLSHMLLTAVEMLLALVISLPLGVATGILVAESRYWGEVLKPLLYFPLSIPKAVFLPLFVLVLGITLTEKVAFGIFSTVFIIVMSTATAIESVSANHVTVARSFGATRRQIVTRVYLPSMLPMLLEGIRLAIIFDFTGILIAEMYGSRSGLGYLISSWGDTFEIRELIAGILLVSVISIALNEAIRAIEHRFGSWRT